MKKHFDFPGILAEGWKQIFDWKCPRFLEQHAGESVADHSEDELENAFWCWPLLGGICGLGWFWAFLVFSAVFPKVFSIILFAAGCVFLSESKDSGRGINALMDAFERKYAGEDFLSILARPNNGPLRSASPWGNLLLQLVIAGSFAGWFYLAWQGMGFFFAVFLLIDCASQAILAGPVKRIAAAVIAGIIGGVIIALPCLVRCYLAGWVPLIVLGILGGIWLIRNRLEDAQLLFSPGAVTLLGKVAALVGLTMAAGFSI